MRKLTCMFVVLLIFGISTNSFGHDDLKKGVTDRYELRNKVWNEYIQLDEFQRHFKENPEDAKKMIDNIVDTKLKINRKIGTIAPKSG